MALPLCLYVGNRVVYGLAAVERLIVLWLIALLVGLFCATVLAIMRRYGFRRTSVGVAGLFLLFFVGIPVWIEVECVLAANAPLRVEGDRVIDNDGAIRSFMRLAGVITPICVLGIIGTLLPWLWPRLSRPRGLA
ncbi:hypothetical protein [Bauldia sp.]|uniref:hypothetical protein n=1 Tax=Bauldia sp. TaxID=2575872 RepID=UPI003BAD9873